MRKSALFLTVGLFSVAMSVALFISDTPAYAEDSTISGQALEIAPPVISLAGDPGQKLEAQINLRDISDTDLIVKSQINNFTANGEDGTPRLLEDEDSSTFSLKEWIAPLPDLTLKPKEIKKLTVTINIPADASPGGYYGAVRFSTVAPELKDTGVSLSASLGTLILLKVNGDAKEGMDIKEFSANSDGRTGWFFESAPIGFNVRLTNTGNVYEQPVGQIAITDMFNKSVANLNVNMPIRYVLSQSTRKFEPLLDKSVIGNKFLFGKYTANLRVKYGTKGATLTQQITFWVIPYKLMSVAIAGLIFLFFILRFFLKSYNQHIINQYHKPRNTHGGRRKR